MTSGRSPLELTREGILAFRRRVQTLDERCRSARPPSDERPSPECRTACRERRRLAASRANVHRSSRESDSRAAGSAIPRTSSLSDLARLLGAVLVTGRRRTWARRCGVTVESCVEGRSVDRHRIGRALERLSEDAHQPIVPDAMAGCRTAVTAPGSDRTGTTHCTSRDDRRHDASVSATSRHRWTTLAARCGRIDLGGSWTARRRSRDGRPCDRASARRASGYIAMMRTPAPGG